MELELNTTHLNCYDTVLDTTLFHEETLETIVPDACPDILRIVDCEAMVCLKGKEAQEGRAEISGSVRAAVLYLPDGAEGVRRMTVTIPFTCSAEALGIHAGCLVTAMPRVHSADARSLNPRKVLTRVDLAVEVSVFARQTESLCDGVTCPAEGGIQQLTETQNAYLVTAVEEKPFSFSDDVSISGTKPRVEELLKSRADIECSESKLIGNKLIFKGEVHLQLLYRDPSNTLCPASFDLPFSQIMEVSGVEEEADCALQVQLTGCECILNDGNDGDSMISVALALLAQAVVREVRPVQLLSDVYSTVCGLHAERRTYTFHQLVENSIMTMPGMTEHQPYYSRRQEVNRLWDSLAAQLPQDCRENLTAVECYWDEQLYGVLRHSFYLGFLQAMESVQAPGNSGSSGSCSEILSRVEYELDMTPRY